jgi:hypothetical protein
MSRKVFSPKRAELIAGWSGQKMIREIMAFLQGHGVSTWQAVRIYFTPRGSRLNCYASIPRAFRICHHTHQSPERFWRFWRFTIAQRQYCSKVRWSSLPVNGASPARAARRALLKCADKKEWDMKLRFEWQKPIFLTQHKELIVRDDDFR